MGKVKIALLGLGTVGTGVWNIIANNGAEIEQKTGSQIEISKVLVRDKFKARSAALPKGVLTTDFDDILGDEDIKIVVEVIGGLDPALQYIEKAIEHKRHVVTANKLLMSKHGGEIMSKAKSMGVALNFEASVCGCIPIINAITEGLNAEKIEEVTGIVNGTTNYILSKMSSTRCSFDDALREAQEKGFAEADPSSDIEGYDALYKLKILTKLAYGADISEHKIYREGISQITAEDIAYAEELGYEIKLIAVSKNIGGTLDVRVHPAMIPQYHYFARINESYNAVHIKGNAMGDLMFCGKGAGELPTGSAVVNDIVNIIRGTSARKKVDAYLQIGHIKKVMDIKYGKFPYYLRLVVRNKAMTIKRIISILEENDIQIASVIKKDQPGKNNTIVFLSREATEFNMQSAIKQIANLPDAIGIGNLIRVENFVISDEAGTQSLKGL